MKRQCLLQLPLGDIPDVYVRRDSDCCSRPHGQQNAIFEVIKARDLHESRSVTLQCMRQKRAVQGSDSLHIVPLQPR